MGSLAIINSNFNMGSESLAASQMVLANTDSSGVTSYIIYPEEEKLVLGEGVSLVDAHTRPSAFSNNTFTSSIDLNATNYARTAFVSDVSGLVDAAQTL
jgi:hypothetical protein